MFWHVSHILRNLDLLLAYWGCGYCYDRVHRVMMSIILGKNGILMHIYSYILSLHTGIC